MQDPYIYVSNPDEFHYADYWSPHGIETTQKQGSHAIFALKVPFIPSFMTSDFTRALIGGSKVAQAVGSIGRIQLVTDRQIRFLNDLINSRFLADGAVAFDLRFIFRPSPLPTTQNKIEIVFLGKAFHPNRRQAEQLGRQLWRKFLSHYPLEDPFNYPLQTVDSEQEFLSYWQPIPIEQMNTKHILEICKFEDTDPYAGEDSTPVGYFPHPFNPSFDASAMGRFLETLSIQQQPCVASICLKPTALFAEELRVVNQLLSQYANMFYESADTGKQVSWLRMYREERFEDIKNTFWPLINQRNHLFKIKIQIFGEHEAPADLVESLGSELIENTTTEPRRWSCERPEMDFDVAIAKHNFLYLEHQQWGRPRMDPTARRLRFLVSSVEAAGAFRLPIPPESGYLPGIEVRDEPFVLPHDPMENKGKTVVLGQIIHRGQPSGQYLHIPIAELTRHGLVAGSTGTGKTNTCLWLLSQLWKRHHVPFLVMYPIDKPDYRILMADRDISNDLLIFTVGDEKISPFRFNPFAIADGILLRTHMSLLMRCFTAAFTMWDPLPAIYRAAIRQVYQDRGWDIVNGIGGDRGTTVPTMADFYDTLVAVAQDMTKDYGREAQGNIRQGSEIRIRDLLLNMGMVVNANDPAPIDELLKHPTVMELGRVGSTEDTALLMGFLLMLLSEQLQSNLRLKTREERSKQMHITLVEEAHRLMSAGGGGSGEHMADPRARGGEDFSNLLAEVRGFGEGILIAEQMPANLVQGAIGNTYNKIMHWLEDHRSFSLFCDIMNLDERQRNYARTLERGQVIIRDRSGHPVHVQVTNYLDSYQTDDDQTIVDDSDAAVRIFMQRQSHLSIPIALPWTPPSSSGSPPTPPVPPKPTKTSAPPLSPPLARFCVNRNAPVFALAQSALTERLSDIAQAANRGNWQLVAQICLDQIQKYGMPNDRPLARCYLARVADLTQSKGLNAGKKLFDAFPFYIEALEHFPL